MKLLLAFLLFSITAPKVVACPNEIAQAPQKYKASPYEIRLLNAIHRHENSQHKGYCMAVLSPNYKGCKAQVKRCLEIIRETWLKWDGQGRKGSYIKKLGLRYCSPKYDFGGHYRWVRGVKYFMKKKGMYNGLIRN